MRTFNFAALMLFLCFSGVFSQDFGGFDAAQPELGFDAAQPETLPESAPAANVEPVPVAQQSVPVAQGVSAGNQIPPLEPKGEFEKQSDFDKRKAKWEKEYGPKESVPTVRPLEPKKEFEKQEDFDSRKAKWEKDAINKLTAKDTTAKGYINRIEFANGLGFDPLTLKALTIVLEDRRLTEESKLITEKAPNAKIEISSYDAETEAFELRVQDTQNTPNPFIFKGNVTVPIGIAKTIDRNNTSDFSTSVVFLNSVYEPDEATKLNLAMSKLLLYKGSKNLTVKGHFLEVESINMSGYYAYKQHTDSILRGLLKPQNLSYKEALKIANGGTSSGEPLMGWRGWTRVATFTLAVVGGTWAAFKHTDAAKNKDDIKAWKNKAETEGIYNLEPGNSTREAWKSQYNKRADALEENELYRSILGVSAGVLATTGILTFFF